MSLLSETYTTTDRKLSTSLPSPRTSVFELLGFAYCPAILPMRTMGRRAPQITIKEKDKIRPILLEMFS